MKRCTLIPKVSLLSVLWAALHASFALCACSTRTVAWVSTGKKYLPLTVLPSMRLYLHLDSTATGRATMTFLFLIALLLTGPLLLQPSVACLWVRKLCALHASFTLCTCSTRTGAWESMAKNYIPLTVLPSMTLSLHRDSIAPWRATMISQFLTALLLIGPFPL